MVDSFYELSPVAQRFSSKIIEQAESTNAEAMNKKFQFCSVKKKARIGFDASLFFNSICFSQITDS
jgi:hypothetical protein